jgi:hypothetical protein
VLACFCTLVSDPPYPSQHGKIRLKFDTHTRCMMRGFNLWPSDFHERYFLLSNSRFFLHQ